MKEDWIECTFAEVIDIISGKNQKKVATPKGKYPIYGSGGVIGRADEYLCESGTTIIGRKGTINSPIYVKEKFWNVDTAFGFYPFPILNNRLLYFFCIYFNFKSLDKSTTIPSLAKRDLLQVNFPLPPLPIQKAIVKKIEELFSSLDSGIADLKKAQAQLKIYRQAVLKKAFETYENSSRSIKDVVEKVQVGPFGSQLHKADYIIDGIPLINPSHIKDGKLKPNSNYTISIKKRNSLPNYILKDGDVIMGRRGEMGRSALITKKEIGWFCGTGSLYLRPNLSILLPSYLNKYIQSAIVKELLIGSATGTTMMNLNKKIIHNLPIPIPSLKQQHQIVSQIERRLSVCDKVEESIKESLQKAQALRQSILKKAFEGKLLSDAEIAKCKADKEYEPASVLLEKIKMEKK